MTITWPAVSLAAAMLVGVSYCGAAVGLAGQVAGVGVAAVAAQVGQHVGADGDRLRLELLEAPVHALRPGAAEAGPARRGLAGHGVGHVLLERQRVDGPRRRPPSCTMARQRAVDRRAAAGHAQGAEARRRAAAVGLA